MADGRTDPDRELAEARVAAAAEARRRQRRERDVLAEESTLAGLLDAVADTGQTVVVVGAGGRRVSGVVTDVGIDVVIVDTMTERISAIRMSSVVAVETPRQPPVGVAGAGTASNDQTMADVVAGLVGTGGTVGLETEGGWHVDGEVLGVGQDLVIVRAGGPETIYVALDSLNEVAWSPSVG